MLPTAGTPAQAAPAQPAATTLPATTAAPTATYAAAPGAAYTYAAAPATTLAYPGASYTTTAPAGYTYTTGAPATYTTTAGAPVTYTTAAGAAPVQYTTGAPGATYTYAQAPVQYTQAAPAPATYTYADPSYAVQQQPQYVYAQQPQQQQYVYEQPAPQQAPQQPAPQVKARGAPGPGAQKAPAGTPVVADPYSAHNINMRAINPNAMPQAAVPTGLDAPIQAAGGPPPPAPGWIAVAKALPDVRARQGAGLDMWGHLEGGQAMGQANVATRDIGGPGAQMVRGTVGASVMQKFGQSDATVPAGKVLVIVDRLEDVKRGYLDFVTGVSEYRVVVDNNPMMRGAGPAFAFGTGHVAGEQFQVGPVKGIRRPYDKEHEDADFKGRWVEVPLVQNAPITLRIYHNDVFTTDMYGTVDIPVNAMLESKFVGEYPVWSSASPPEVVGKLRCVILTAGDHGPYGYTPGAGRGQVTNAAPPKQPESLWNQWQMPSLAMPSVQLPSMQQFGIGAPGPQAHGAQSPAPHQQAPPGHPAPPQGQVAARDVQGASKLWFW